MLNTNIISKIDHLPIIALNEIAQAVNKARSEGRDIIDFSQLNPNIPPPSQAVEKLVQSSLQPTNHRYSSSQGISKLRETFCNWYANRFEVELNFDTEVVVTLGTKQGISHLLFGALSTGDTVLLPTPAYPIHQASVILAGAKLVDVPLASTEEEDSVWKNATALTEKSESFFKRLERAYQQSSPKPKLMIISFPHNPTTTVVTLGFLERLVAFAKDYRIYLIHDFAYADLAFDGFKTPSLLQVAGAKEISVEFYSLSKGLCLAGWRIGVCAGNPELVAVLKKVKSFLDYGPFQPLQIGAIKALESYQSIISETVEIYKSRRDVLVSGLKNLSWQIEPPKGSLFVWAKIPQTFPLQNAKEFAAFLLQHNVAVCPGDGFGAEYSKYIRFSLVVPENRIRQAIANIEQGLRNL